MQKYHNQEYVLSNYLNMDASLDLAEFKFHNRCKFCERRFDSSGEMGRHIGCKHTRDGEAFLSMADLGSEVLDTEMDQHKLNLKIEKTNKLNHGATAGIQTIKLAATTWIQDTRYQTPDTYSQIKILRTFYLLLLSHTACTTKQDQARYLKMWTYELLIILWTKQHQTYKKCSIQELGFLDRQNYQLCLQENTDQKKNLACKDTRLQFTQDSRSPFGAFWTCGLKKKFFFFKKFKNFIVNHCYCMR